jgi:endonuclease YncB( thermonuclease family)
MTRVLVLLACFTLPAQVVRVVDGDTFDVTMRAWLNVTVNERVRVLNVDAWEMRQALGPQAKRFAVQWLADHAAGLMLTTCERDSFGRILSVVKDGTTGETLADALKSSGNSKP